MKLGKTQTISLILFVPPFQRGSGQRSIMFRAVGNINIFSDIISIGERIKKVREMPMVSSLQRERRLQAAKRVMADLRLETFVGPNVPPDRWDLASDKLLEEGPTVDQQRFAAERLQFVRVDRVNTKGKFLAMQREADLDAPEIEADIDVGALAYNNYLCANELRQYQDGLRDGKAGFYLQSGEPVPLAEAIPPIATKEDWDVDTGRETIVHKCKLLQENLVNGEKLHGDLFGVALALSGRPGVGGNPKLPASVAVKISDLSVCDNKIYIYPQNHPAVAIFQSAIERQSENAKRPVVAEIAAGLRFEQLVEALNQLISFFT